MVIFLNMDKKYDIFISYRRVDSEGRTSGRDIARTIKLELDRRGYKVLFDNSEIKDNEFEDVILPAIHNSAVFIVVLSKDALLRCSNKKDWVRREIETALNSGCKVIPVSPDGAFSGYPTELPDSLFAFAELQVSEISMGPLFQISIDKLDEERIKNYIKKESSKKEEVDLQSRNGIMGSETTHQESQTKTKERYFAFISYSRKDLKIATEIKKEIESVCKYECWMDLEGIESGDQFEDVIISAIDNSKIVIFLMSNNSMSSVYSKKEVRYADSIKKKIVPVSIDNSKPSGWFLFNFGGTDVIDYNNVEQKKKLFTNLVEWSKSLRPQKNEKLPLIFTKGNDYLPVIHLFLLIDTSGSMYGERIEATNMAFSNVLSSFEILNPDIEIRIAVLEFNSSVRWMHEIPQPLDSFVWMPLEPGGLTQMGEALSTLNGKMQRTGYFNSYLCKGSIIPSLIILLTDGEPTDDYSKGLKEIIENPYFKKATKFAIGIGDDFSIKPLVDFTGNHKTVFQIKDENASSDLTSLLTRLITMGLYAGSVSSLNND